LIGALFNLLVFVYGMFKQVHQVSFVAGVLVVLCLVWAVAARFVSRAPYFTQETVAHPPGGVAVTEEESVGESLRSRWARSFGAGATGPWAGFRHPTGGWPHSEAVQRAARPAGPLFGAGRRVVGESVAAWNAGRYE